MEFPQWVKNYLLPFPDNHDEPPTEATSFSLIPRLVQLSQGDSEFWRQLPWRFVLNL
jgi:hypothetical protein